MSDLPEFNIDPSQIARDVAKQERVDEIRKSIETWKADEDKNRAQKDLERSIVLENLKAAVNMKLMTPSQAEQYLAAKLEEERRAKMDGLHMHRDGYYVDRQGNKYDEDGNFVE